MAAAAFCIAIASPAQTRFKQLPCGFDLNNSLRFYSRSRFSLPIASNSKTRTPLLSSKSQIHSLSCFGWGGGKEDETGAVSCESYVKNGGQNSDDDVAVLGWFQRMLMKLNIMMNGVLCALKNPIRCLFLFWVVSQISVSVAPKIFKYFPPTWSCASILAFVWFLTIFKTNGAAQMMSAYSITGLDLDRWIVLDKMISIGIIVIGLVASAQGYNYNLLTFVTVGSLGVVFAAASFATDILKNVFSRLWIHFYNIFRIGDRVKAGSIEGKVVEMGLTRTTLLSIENFFLTVPNSCFLEEVVVNESCVAYKAILTRIPLQSEDLSKIALILKDIAGMLTSNATVLLKYDLPYCYLSRIGSSFVELTIGYNLRNTTMTEICTAEQDILLQAVEIINKHGVALDKK